MHDIFQSFLDALEHKSLRRPEMRLFPRYAAHKYQPVNRPFPVNEISQIYKRVLSRGKFKKEEIPFGTCLRPLNRDWNGVMSEAEILPVSSLSA